MIKPAYIVHVDFAGVNIKNGGEIIKLVKEHEKTHNVTWNYTANKKFVSCVVYPDYSIHIEDNFMKTVNEVHDMIRDAIVNRGGYFANSMGEFVYAND